MRPPVHGLAAARKATPIASGRHLPKIAVLSISVYFAAQGGTSWLSLASQSMGTSVPQWRDASFDGRSDRGAASLDSGAVSGDGPRSKVRPMRPVERRAAVAVAISVAVVTGGGSVVRAGGIDKARDQLLAARTALDDLIAGYGDIVKRGGGDAVRAQLGKTGTGPLFKLEKVCSELATVADDPSGFTDALEEFALASARADGNLYSSVFAGGSGDPKKNNPKVFIARAKDDIQVMRDLADKMIKLLGPANTA